MTELETTLRGWMVRDITGIYPTTFHRDEQTTHGASLMAMWMEKWPDEKPELVRVEIRVISEEQQ